MYGNFNGANAGAIIKCGGIIVFFFNLILGWGMFWVV
jgi:hypothetical protein